MVTYEVEPPKMTLTETGKGTDDKFTWVYLERDGRREYLAGTAGRMTIADARAVAAALNEYSLCCGESR